MDIIFQGKHDSEQAIEYLSSVVRLMQERYNISQFREMHLTFTLVDAQGDDVDLVDSDTLEAFRVLEVYREGYDLMKRRGAPPPLKLVVDNTRR